MRTRNSTEKVGSGKGPPVRVILVVDPISAQKIWNQIKHRYKQLGDGCNPLNAWLRDLIRQETGVDISPLWSRWTDPLCSKKFAADLIKANEDEFDDRQKLWIKLRGMGMNYTDISKFSQRELKQKGFKGVCPTSVCQFFIRLRDDLGLDRPRRIREEAVVAEKQHSKNWGIKKGISKRKLAEAVVNAD